MKAIFANTPNRGQSQISKALPVPPGPEPSILSMEGNKEPVLISGPLNLMLPANPRDAMSTKPTMSITRRPVRVQTIPSKPSEPATASSVYSASPRSSRSFSDSSRETKDSLSSVDSEIGATSVLPVGDKQTPEHVLATHTLGFQSSPPQQPQIWKRRHMKSGRNISITELKLEKSNGSSTTPPQQPSRERSLPPVPSQLPRSIPGRKPVPQRPAPPQPGLMGNKVSKRRTKTTKASEEEDPRNDDEAATQPYPPFKRIPTPEHLKADDDTQPSSISQDLSSISLDPVPTEQPPEIVVPPRPDSRRSSTAFSTLTSRPGFLPVVGSRESSELTITSEPAVKRSPQPRRAFGSRILTSHSSLSRASDNVSSLTPRVGSGIFPPGTILVGPCVEKVHLECYQSHRFMRGAKNTLCPVACMICEGKDTEPRWRCTWCCLSACASCMQVLSSIPGRDLAVCLERIRGKGWEEREEL